MILLSENFKNSSTTGRKTSSTGFEGMAFPLEILLNNSFFTSATLEPDAGIFLMAVIEYVCADILKLAGNYAENHHRRTIDVSDIRSTVTHSPIPCKFSFGREIELLSACHLPVSPSCDWTLLSRSCLWKFAVISCSHRLESNRKGCHGTWVWSSKSSPTSQSQWKTTVRLWKIIFAPLSSSCSHIPISYFFLLFLFIYLLFCSLRGNVQPLHKSYGIPQRILQNFGGGHWLSRFEHFLVE